MSGADTARPSRASALAWVLASVIVAALLAALTQAIGAFGHNVPGGPLTLGKAEVLLQDAGAPALSPAQALAERRWRPTSLPFAAGWTRNTVWVRMQVHNTSTQPQSAWLEVSPSWLVDVRVHELGPDGRWTTQISGNGMLVTDRPVQVAELAFPLELAPGEQRSVLVETTNQRFALTLGVTVQPAAAFAGQAERSNLLDLTLIGALVMLGLVCLVFGLALRHLGLVLLAARAFVGVLLQLQQFGAGALFLSASASAALNAHAGWLFWAAQVLLVAFIWSFMSQAGLARWAHGVYASLLAIILPLAATHSYQMHALLLMPLLGFTLVLLTHLIFKGYLPAVALLVGLLSAVMINAPVLTGHSLGWVPRYAISPLPLLITLPMLCLAAGLALRRERQLVQRALHEAQSSALRGLEEEVAKRTVALQAARDEATRANQAKSLFMAKVTHELRTPMHVMLGYLDLALRGPVQPQEARQLGIARHAGHRLVTQVNDLLDQVRDEQAELKLMPTAIDLQQLAQSLAGPMGLLERDNGNHFELDADTPLPCVWLDGRRLEQVLLVLLNNAMRYTRQGRVTLRIRVLDTPPDGPWSQDDSQPGAAQAGLSLRFEVRDSGRGIAAADLARLGQPYERGASGDALVPGLGLGLVVAKQWLVLMGSQLEVTSELGAGSCFAFTLHARRAVASPLAAGQGAQFAREPAVVQGTPVAARPLPAGPASDGGRQRQVLVLEDDADGRALLEELLMGLGFGVRTFGGVADALAHLHTARRAGHAAPDLCIVDQHLELADGDVLRGRQSGWEFIRALRGLWPPAAHDHAATSCPVLMLSATDAMAPPGWLPAHAPQRRLLKPVDPRTLQTCIGDLLQLPWLREDTMPVHDAAPQAAAIPAESGQAWHELAEIGDSGFLDRLDEWTEAHAQRLAVDPQLQRLVQSLDFEGLARHARRSLTARS